MTAALAIRHANERNGSVLPALATIDPSFTVRGTYYNTDSSAKVGLLKVWQAWFGMDAQGYRVHPQGADAIVGAYRSEVSQSIALVAGWDGLPQLSPTSAAQTLTNKVSYPYFGRTYPNAELSAGLLAPILCSFGWRNVAVVHVDDADGNGYVTALTQAAKECSGDPLHIFDVSYTYNGDDLQAALRRVHVSEHNIIVVLTFDLAPYLAKAKEMGILTSSYAHIVVDGKGLSADLDEEHKMLLPGMLSWGAVANNSRGREYEYDHFVSVWKSLTPRDCATGSVFTPDASVFAEPPPDNAAFMYDAVAAMVLALAAANLPATEVKISSCPLFDVTRTHEQRTRTLTELRALNFSGTTGQVIFDGETGDRNTSTVGFSLDNYVNGQGWVQRRRRGEDQAPEDSTSPIIWIGHSTRVPKDVLNADTSLGWEIQLLISLLVVPIAVLTLLLLAYRWNQRRKRVFRLAATGLPPRLGLAPGMRWHLFLSHT